MQRIVLLASALIASQAYAQEPPWAAQVDEIAKSWSRKDGPGGVVGVALDGKLVFTKGYGLANVEHGVPNAADIVMDVGSVSKQFTAICVLLLEEEGKLKTSDLLVKYVPELPAVYKDVTIDHLLHMTGGLRDYLTIWVLEGWNGFDSRNDAYVVETLGRQQALNFEPGSRFLYCNSNYVLLGVIVERVSGKPLARYAAENVFKPLGMDATKFDTEGPVVRHRATSYTPVLGGYQPLASALQVIGDGGVLSTVADLAKWHANLMVNKLGNGEPSLVAKLAAPGTPPGAGLAYACGLVVDAFQGVRRIGHDGNWLGFNATTMLFPEQRVSVFSLGNDGAFSNRAIGQRVAELALGLVPVAVNEPQSATVPQESKEALAGTYRLPDGRALTIRLDGEQLKLQVEGQPAFDLWPSGGGRFYIKEPRVVITQTATGTTLKQGGGELPLERHTPFEASEDELKKWEGTYTSTEVMAEIRISAEGQSLRIEIGKGPPMLVRLASADTLRSPAGTATLVRDASGKVRGLFLDAGRALGIRFTKIG